jgi:hypothetical protein
MDASRVVVVLLALIAASAFAASAASIPAGSIWPPPGKYNLSQACASSSFLILFFSFSPCHQLIAPTGLLVCQWTVELR